MFSLLLFSQQQTIELRDYQKTLLEVCVAKNSIVFLPTGAGKTLIAVNVIKHFSSSLKLDLKDGGKRSLFLVNTVALGEQVAAEIRKLLGFKVAYWSSETSKKTTWIRERYQRELNDNQIIVATAQLFVDAVKHSFVNIDQLNVIVFDECHHGRGNSPYHEMMKQFKYVEPSKQPRIIGLSGQLIGISSKITEDTICDELATLESTFLATIVTVNRLQEYKNVMIYSTNPKEGFIKFNIDQPTELIESIKNKVDKIRWELSLIKIPSMRTINPQTLKETIPKKLRTFSLQFEEVKFSVEELGLFGTYLTIKSIRIQFQLFKRQPNLERKVKEVLNFCLEEVAALEEMIKEYVDFDDEDLTSQMIIEYSSAKVKSLIGILMTKFNGKSENEDFQSLVFVSRRCTAKCLYHLVKRYCELDRSVAGIKPDFVVGVNGTIPESISEVLSANNNEFAIERFRMKETNLIFASSVLEEGMDLQSCNLVIMFDYPLTFRAYIQSKGRARSKTSDYIVLVPSTKAVSFLSNRNKYDRIDRDLKKILITKTCDRKLNTEEVERERVDEWDPLITKKQALLNNISSVALLNRFVQKYGNPNLLFERKDYGPGKIKAILKLPPQTKIYELIESDFFPDIKLAKQHAAFKACLRLYEIGELDEHLLPDYRGV